MKLLLNSEDFVADVAALPTQSLPAISLTSKS